MGIPIFEIPISVSGALAITPRPRGGDWLDVDIAALSAEGIEVLVSLLETEESCELSLEGEQASCAAHGVEFLSLPVPDLGTPLDSPKFLQAAVNLARLLRGGKRIAIHCRQSVGRSGLLATSIAVAAGVGLTEAIEAVSRARGVQVPETLAQLEWLRRYEPQLSASERSP
jgi:protein-tyrosine phosphatase